MHKLTLLKMENCNGSSALTEVSSHKLSPSDRKISIIHYKIFFLCWGWGGDIMFKYNVL